MKSASVLRSRKLAAGAPAHVVRVYEPARFAKGGLAQAASNVRSAGRAGDEILLHITPEEFSQLKEQWGEPSTNPHTGLPEYGFFSKLKKFVKNTVGFELFHGKDMLKQLVSHPQRLLTGVDPLMTAATNKIFGTKYAPIVDQMGGALPSDYAKAEAEGIDTGAGKTMQGLAHVIAANYAAKGLGPVVSKGLGALMGALGTAGAQAGVQAGTQAAGTLSNTAITKGLGQIIPALNDAVSPGEPPPTEDTGTPFNGTQPQVSRIYTPFSGDYMNYGMGPQYQFYQQAANGGRIVRSPEVTGGDYHAVRFFGRQPQQKFRTGGLAQAVEKTKSAGRGDDEVLLHLTKPEFEFLRAQWGEPDKNPHTGLPEYGWAGDIFASILPAITGSKSAEGSGSSSNGMGSVIGNVLGSVLGGQKESGEQGGIGSVLSNVLGSVLGGPKATAPIAGTYDELLKPGEMGPPKVLGQKPAAGSALLDMAKKYWPVALMAAAALGHKKPKEAKAPELPDAFTTHLPQLTYERKAVPQQADWYTYGQRPETSFYDNNAIPDYDPTQGKKSGGALKAATRFVRGPGSGRSDSIPARLSDGEYVFTAEDVALLGDGSSQAGAQKLDKWREELRKHKGSKLAKGEISPDAKSPEQYLKGNRRG